jgi:manganese/iron transport system substrate-binding protein
VIDAMREQYPRRLLREHRLRQARHGRSPPKPARTYGGILYVDSLSEADGPVPTYLDLLRVTSETIVKGLSQ